MSNQPYPNFGAYRVLGGLGSGGMGRVLLVANPKGERFALKHIHPNLLQQSNYYQRFQREMDLMQRLRHPNLMPLLDRGTAGNLPYYIMPYIDGLSVKDYIRQYGPLTPEQTYNVVDAVCYALVYLHAQGVYHRDIKPHNIMLDRQWTPFLTDFGIAADMRANNDLTSTMQRAGMGTQSYTAPEIHGGAAASARSDLYSLGITVYEMFTGEHLFKAYTRDTEDPYAALPDELRPVILRAIDHNPKARFQTVKDFQQAYQQASQRSLRPKQMPALVRLRNADATESRRSATATQPHRPAPATGSATPVSGISKTPVSRVTPQQPPQGVPVALTILIIITAVVAILLAVSFISGSGNSQTERQTGTAQAALAQTERAGTAVAANNVAASETRAAAAAVARAQTLAAARTATAAVTVPPTATSAQSSGPLSWTGFNGPSIQLQRGFSPDPRRVNNITSSGTINLDFIDCPGYAAREPDVELTWTRRSDILRLYFVGVSGDDPVMIVKNPGNSLYPWYCDDDSYGNLNPEITIQNAPPGTYYVWIGTYESRDTTRGSLFISDSR